MTQNAERAHLKNTYMVDFDQIAHKTSNTNGRIKNKILVYERNEAVLLYLD